jgi:hypothetical protein
MILDLLIETFKATGEPMAFVFVNGLLATNDLTWPEMKAALETLKGMGAIA